MFEKNLAIAGLFDRYAPVLNERHRTVMDLYYNQDLSLREIAEMIGISRQGVRDSIKKAEEELYFLEAGLQLNTRAKRATAAAERLFALAGNDEALCDALRLVLTEAGIYFGENE